MEAPSALGYTAVMAYEAGQSWGRLTLVAPTEQRAASSERLWAAQCTCGKQCVVRPSRLKNGNTKSCGCLRRERTSATGKSRAGKPGHEGSRINQVWDQMRFGDLWVMNIVSFSDVPSKRRYICRCLRYRPDREPTGKKKTQEICGNVVIATAQELAYGTRRSCGCGRIAYERVAVRDAEHSLEIHQRRLKAAYDAYVAGRVTNEQLAATHGVAPADDSGQEHLRELRKKEADNAPPRKPHPKAGWKKRVADSGAEVADSASSD